MFCEKCGTKADKTSKFCEKCGNKLDNDVIEKKTKTEKKKDDNNDKKTSTISKKTKVLLIVIVVIAAGLFGAYKYGESKTSKETIAKQAFEQLTKKKKIEDKLLTVSLDNEDYFISLADNIESVLEEQDISLKHNDYEIRESDDSVIIKFKDTEDKEKYKIKFDFVKDGKTLLIYDNYKIEKITIKRNDSYKEYKLYDPDNIEKLTLKTVKNSKISLNKKEIKKSYLDKKKSNDDYDVYVVKGIQPGTYNGKITLGGFTFKHDVAVYSKNKNEYDLTDYISSHYLEKDEDKIEEMADSFSEYINKYYKYVADTDKTVNDFAKEYKLTDSIKETFAESKEYTYYTSFGIDKVEFNSFSYDEDKKQFVISYKVNYTYTTEYNPDGRKTYQNVRVTYDMSDLDLPVDLDYMPY